MSAQHSALSTEFVRQLRGALSPADWSEMLARNAAEQDSSICHSHDFCDANEVMASAFEAVIGRPCFLVCDGDAEQAVEADCGICSAAWALAKPALRAEGSK